MNISESFEPFQVSFKRDSKGRAIGKKNRKVRSENEMYLMHLEHLRKQIDNFDEILTHYNILNVSF